MLRNAHVVNYWSRLSLSYRGAAIVTIPALCLLATLGGWLWSRSAASEFRTQLQTTQERIETTNNVLISVLNAETSVRGYLLSDDRRFLEPFQIAQPQLAKSIDRLTSSVDRDRQKSRQINAIRLRIRSIQSLLIELQTAASAGIDPQLLSQSKQQVDILRREITAFAQVEQASLDRQYTAQSNFQALVQSLQQLLGVAGVISSLGGIYLFWLLERELNDRDERIQTSESTIDTLSNDIVDGIAIINSAGQIKTVNPALLEMFGYSTVDLLECPFMRMLIPRTIARSRPLADLSTWLAQKPKLGRIWQIEAYRQDGTHFPIELSVSEIPQKQQRIAIIRDVSAQANLRQQLHVHLAALERLNLTLVHTNSSLERRNQELAEFAYVTAHDLKTPVRGIATLSEWIEAELENYSAPAGLQHHLQLLRQRTYRLNALIDGLWEYSHLGQTSVTPEPVEITTLLDRIQADRQFPANFEIKLTTGKLHLITCKSHLRKVLEELLENAIVHHDLDRGQIEISAELIGDGKIEIIVRDDGPGIAVEHRQRVFRLFETLEPSYGHSSTGSGLAIAKKLVERVGGMIWLKTPAPGRGLAVHFTWPQQSLSG